MATKTANVNVRVEQNIKEQAEAILDTLGISVSSFINMTYRQVIMHKGIPYDLSLPSTIQVRDCMTDEAFNKMLETGLKQAREGDVIPLDEAFDSLTKGL